ncbi:hypothetical protein [Streptomyces sp. NPDC053048]|uniref:hypothetical protein n=1 Tax=Streptomyces sp. NPDC053048 TaxID=3365694 RepID=UPI0037D7B166
MDLYTNHDTTEWTELRVHGVSGTPPEASLGHPRVTLVAGDARAGFYRREWENKDTAQDTAEFRREAYSWGGLTSGNGQRALWLLLLPFMFLNMAYYTDPGHTVDRPSRRVRLRACVQRLLAFSLTGTYVLAAVSASMGLIGWQCGHAALSTTPVPQCAGGAGWLQWLHYGWLDTTGRHLAATALVPVALVALLWYLGNKTWSVSEARIVPQSTSDRPPDVRTPLEDRRLWNGRGPVRRLRALHVSGAFALTAVFLLAPLLERPERGAAAVLDGANWTMGTAFFRSLALVLALALLACAVVMVALPGPAHRARPRAGKPGSGERERDGYRILPWAGLTLVVGAAVAASWGAGRTDAATAGQLPWEVAWIHVLLIAQLALLLLLLLSQTGVRRPAPAPSFPRLPRSPWYGLVLTGTALLGWAMAQALAAGVTLRTAETLGEPAAAANAGREQIRLAVPDAYFWEGTGALLLIVLAIALVGASCRSLRGARGRFALEVDAAYDGTRDDPRRRTGIAKAWARAQTLESAAQRALGCFLVGTGVVTVAGVVLFLCHGPSLVVDHPALLLVANLVLSIGVLALLWAGRQAYRSPRFRRTVGILWDIGTFWPRATHPLAPPCYAERTVPDLLSRLEYLTGGENAAPGRQGHVVLSCHSQGTVIGAALVLQTVSEADERVRLLTYGSPITPLFVRFFPAYFNATSLGRLGALLTAPGPADGPDRWRWRNLYRPSDPIGSWVLEPARLPRAGDPVDPVPAPVDRQLLDPRHFARQPGDPSYPAVRGHSNYFADPAFEATVRAFRLRSGIP